MLRGDQNSRFSILALHFLEFFLLYSVLLPVLVVDLHFELEQPYSSNKFSTRRTGSIRRSAVPMPKVPVPAKVNHHVYRSVPPRMERLSLSKGPFRYQVGPLRLPGFSTGLPGNLH